jgi:PAS domain S-box-containing protein
MRFKYSILYLIIAILVIVAGSTLFIGFYVNSETLRDSLEASEANKVHDIIYWVNADIQKSIKNISTLSQLLQQNDILMKSLSQYQLQGDVKPLQEVMGSLYPTLTPMGVDFFLVTDNQGKIAYQASAAEGGGGTFKAWGLEEALAGETILETGYGSQGWAMRAMTPLSRAGKEYGVLVLGIRLDDAFARKIGKATQTHISFATPFQILASSWPPAERQQVELSWVLRSFQEKRWFFHLDKGGNISSFYVPMEIGDETLCVVINTDTAPIFNLLKEKRRHLFLSFLMVVVVILGIGSGLSFSIVSPLRALQQRALAVIRDFSQEDQTVAPRGNEIATLSQAMELMLAVIQARLTDLEEVHETLQERENFLASVFNSIQDGIVVMDQDLTILRANPSEEYQLRHDLPMVGRKCYELRHGRSHPCEDCPCLQAMETGRTGYLLKKVNRGEKTDWVETFAFPLQDLATGQVTGVIEYIRDVTERHLAEEARAEEAIRRRILVEQSRDGIVVLDETGKVYEANQRYAEMLGYAPEEVRLLYIWDWDAQWSREELLEKLRCIDVAGDYFETRHRRRDGTIFDVEISTNGAVLGGQKLVFCVCRDISQRKAAERALRESEEKYRLLVKQIPAVVFRGYADWSLDTFDDQKIEKLTGYPKEDFDTRRRKWSDLILPEDLPQVKGKFLEGLKSAGTYEREYRIRKKSGEIIWVQVQGRIFLDATGMIDHISGVISDVTARKTAAEALLKYEFIANTAKDCMTLIDRHYVYEAANAAYCQAHGKTREEVVGQSVASIWGQDTFDSTIKSLLDQCFTGQAVEFEGWFPFGQRGRGCYSVSYNPYFSEDGTVAYAAVVSHDITDRKRAEEELRKSRDLSLSIMESLPGIFYLYDEQGRLRRWNKNLEEISQYSALEILGMHPQDFFTDYDKPRAREAIRTCFATGEVRLEAELLTKNGVKLPYVLTGRRIFMEGKPHLVGMGLDISQRRQMEEALKKRLVALSRPLDDAGDIDFNDLFNLEEIQRIQDLFAEITGVASLITTPEGIPITRPSNFCRLCGDIVRQTELGAKRCQDSEARMGRIYHDGPNVQHCLSAGLCNAGACITVGGKHIANWLIGQVRDETENEEKLREYARAVGADEKEFIAAFHEIPKMSKERFQQVAQALFVFASQLSAMAYQNVQQARFITERQQAEEAIRERESMLSLVINTVPQEIFWKDLDSVYLGCNQNYARAAGLETPAAIVGKTEYDLPWRPEETETFLAGDREVMQTKQARYHQVETIQLADGRQIWVDGTKMPLLAGDNTVIGVLGVYQDITERKKMEEELRESEASYRTLAQNLPGLVYRVFIRENYRMEFYNNMLESMTGYTLQELCHSEVCSLDPYILSEDMEKVGQMVKQAIARDRIFEVEYRFRHKDGSIHYFAERGKPIPGEDGKFSHIDGVIWDVTEAKQLAAAVQESEQRFRGLVEHLPMGIMIVQDGGLVYQNPEQERLFGYLHTENCQDLLLCAHPDDVSKAEQFCQGIMANLPQADITLRFIPLASMTSEKRSIWVNCRGSAIEYRSRKAMLINMVDITRTKEMERLMLIREKMASLGQVAAGIAHEIRNPLSGINVFLDGIKENFQDPENTALVQELIDAAQATSNRIEAVIRRVLDFSRPAELRLAPTDINLAVDNAIKLTATSLRKEDIKIDHDLATGLPLVQGDLQLLEQALVNIITNAGEALRGTGKPGQIKIATQKTNAGVLVTVNDSGPGIPPEIRDKIFDPFFTTKADGSGIGLSICHRIITDHGGTLEVSASDLGGTQFMIHLFGK